MTDPVTLKQIQELAGVLSRHGVTTPAELRRCISVDVDEGIQWLAINTGTSETLLMALLLAEFAEDTLQKDNRTLARHWQTLKTFPAVASLSAIDIRDIWRDRGLDLTWESGKPIWHVVRQSLIRTRHLLSNWRRHWFDLLVLVVLPLILISLFLQVLSANKKNVRHVAVQPGAGLPVFHRITGEVELKGAPGLPGAFTSIDQVKDRYTLVALPGGSMVESNQLLSADLSNKMQNRNILTVPIKPGNYLSTLSPPAEAIMLLSPRQLDLKAEAVSFPVIVLRLESNGEMRSATVALTEDRFKIAAALLASHDIFLSQDVP